MKTKNGWTFCVLKNVSIIIPTTPDEPELQNLLTDLESLDSEIIISSEGTRAESLNAGAAKSNREFLWFLHADTRVTGDNIAALEKSIQAHPKSLLYFELTGLPSLNNWGANLRSRLFSAPFGDQGFCLSKAAFENTYGYPKDVPYGEDLLFVKRSKLPLKRIPSKLKTSNRRYQNENWFKIVLLNQWRWITLALKG